MIHFCSCMVKPTSADLWGFGEKQIQSHQENGSLPVTSPRTWSFVIHVDLNSLSLGKRGANEEEVGSSSSSVEAVHRPSKEKSEWRRRSSQGPCLCRALTRKADRRRVSTLLDDGKPQFRHCNTSVVVDSWHSQTLLKKSDAIGMTLRVRHAYPRSQLLYECDHHSMMMLLVQIRLKPLQQHKIFERGKSVTTFLPSSSSLSVLFPLLQQLVRSSGVRRTKTWCD
jgi:hypothetical protein